MYLPQHDDDVQCDCTACYSVRATRDRTVAALRRKARAHERLSRLRSHHGPTSYFDQWLSTYHEGAADALETMADRIERGDV